MASWAEARPTAPPERRHPRRTLLRGLPIGPSVILLLVFLAGPILYCVYAAFTNMALTGQVGTQFVGFENFTRAFGDPAFISSVGLTLIFTLLSAIIGQNVLGMILALLMRSGHTIVRAFTSAVVIGAWQLALYHTVAA